MLRGSFIWTHKPEHLLMVAGARMNTLGQLGSLSRSLISHAAKQSCRVGARSASAVPPGSACFSELAVCFIHTALMNTSELKNGKSLDRSGYWTTWDRYLIPCTVWCLYIWCGITSSRVAQLQKLGEIERVRYRNGPWLAFATVNYQPNSVGTTGDLILGWFQFQRPLLEAPINCMLIFTMKRSNFQPVHHLTIHVREWKTTVMQRSWKHTESSFLRSWFQMGFTIPKQQGHCFFFADHN